MYINYLRRLSQLSLLVSCFKNQLRDLQKVGPLFFFFFFGGIGPLFLVPLILCHPFFFFFSTSNVCLKSVLFKSLPGSTERKNFQIELSSIS